MTVYPDEATARLWRDATKAAAMGLLPSYPAAPQESERDRALSAIAAIRRALDALEAALKVRE